MRRIWDEPGSNARTVDIGKDDPAIPRAAQNTIKREKIAKKKLLAYTLKTEEISSQTRTWRNAPCIISNVF
jgi:hypothetical protein